MVVTIGNFATAGMLIFGILCIIVLIFAAAFADIESKIIEVIVMISFGLWIICAGTAAFTHIFFSDEYSNHKLEYVTTTRHERLVKECPNEEGLCRLKWLDYRADSMKAEYQVQRAKFDD